MTAPHGPVPRLYAHGDYTSPATGYTEPVQVEERTDEVIALRFLGSEDGILLPRTTEGLACLNFAHKDWEFPA